MDILPACAAALLLTALTAAVPFALAGNPLQEVDSVCVVPMFIMGNPPGDGVLTRPYSDGSKHGVISWIPYPAPGGSWTFYGLCDEETKLEACLSLSVTSCQQAIACLTAPAPPPECP